MITFTVPGPPGHKGRPRFVRATGRAHTPEKTAKWETLCGWYAREAMQDRTPIEGAIGLAIEAVLPIPASWSKKKREMAAAGLVWATVKPDFENVEKIVADALNGIVFVDDKQVVQSHFLKSYGDEPRTVIRIEELG